MKHSAFLFVFAFAFLAVFCCLSSARAQDQTALRAMFESIMDKQKQAATERGDTLNFEGDIQIEDAGSYYAATLPHASLTTKEGNTLEIGMIAVNASPQSKPGIWKVTIALPTPFTLKDSKGTPLMTMSVGSQSVTGIWNNNIEYFTQLNADYRDIIVQDVTQGFSAKLGTLGLKSDLTETAPGKWSGPIDIKLEKLEAVIPDRQMKISLGSATNRVHLLSYDPALIQSKRAELSALQEKAANSTKNEEQNLAIGTLIFDLLTKSGDGLKTDYAVENFEVIAPQPGQQAMGKFSLEKGSLSLVLSGFSEDKVTLLLGLDYEGLDPRPLSAHIRNVMPRETHLEWELKNVPVQQLAATLQNTLGGLTSSTKGMNQMGMAALMFKLPAILSQAGTALTVEKNYINNDLYRAELDGDVKTDLSAFTGFVSDFMLKVYGLDNLITALENAAAEPTTMYRTTIGGWASNLRYFKGFGLRQKDDQSTPYYTYHFELTPQGQMLLNDKDAAAMLSGSLLPPIPGELGGGNDALGADAPAQ